MSGAADPVYDAIRSRRVTRQMDGRPVEAADLDRVVRAARYAPNAGNRRLQPVIPVSSPRLLQLLRLVAPGMLPRPAAAAVICIDKGRAAGFGFRSDAPGLFVDVGTTAATMLLAAHAIGLASCPVTSFSRAAVARLLGLGESISPELIVCLGHAGGVQPPPMPAAGSEPSPPDVNR